MPPSRHARPRSRRRDAGLRRVSAITRGLAAASLALVGGFAALAARTHTGAKSTVRSPSPATTPRIAAPAAPAAPAAQAAGTLPPDTFPRNGATVPPTAAPLRPPPNPPQTVPSTVPPVTAPPITSAPS